MFFGPKAIAIGRLATRLRDRGHSIAVQEILMLAAARGNVDMRTGLLISSTRNEVVARMGGGENER